MLPSLHPPVARWFSRALGEPTRVQRLAFPAIAAGGSAVLCAPTGSGKTLAAFLVALDRLLFAPEPARAERCRVLYVSPLKALGVDVEKNLRRPLAGISAEAAVGGDTVRTVNIAIRSGDTPARERARIGRAPPDILITTPESVFLLLTSRAREVLAHVDTVIVDEIHALLPGKRGVHLALSLERLEALRSGRPPLQRLGLSATQRPLAEVARFLGGHADTGTPRPVQIIDAAEPKRLALTVEVPVEDMAKLAVEGERAAPGERSIWPAIHPRLVELIRAHRSTIVFANSRRLAERLAQAINDTAGEELALAHHGSIAKEQRLLAEERLKQGTLPALVATSSLELGIDMGAVDLVIQIEAPPSVASGLQRVGRAGHQVGAASTGIIFPKHRGDLLAAAAVTAEMEAGRVEPLRYPRNCLDVLAQQLVAMVTAEELPADLLFARVRQAAPFAELSRSSFDGVLDLLSGLYPSEELRELVPRVVWDRARGGVRAREGAQRVVVVNAGTIPDRGLFGVFFPAPSGKLLRVGELDEEMVLESREGDVFLLGASAWRIREITPDRVLVEPAPGEAGRMPFWRGDRPGRPVALGQAMGALARELLTAAPDHAAARLEQRHGLDPRAAKNLLDYLAAQVEATGECPSDQCLVLERFRDPLGDWRIVLLGPFGAKLFAPWATLVRARLLERRRLAEVDLLWTDDGIAFRLPDSTEPPEVDLFFPPPEEVQPGLMDSLAGTALFAARFREAAARALLLPRRSPGQRAPLWSQRKRAGDILAVASRYPRFPLILETYRECMQEVFDVPGLEALLQAVRAGTVRVVTADTRRPSPFASSVLFSFVGAFLYDGDLPVAERRAQAMSVDPEELEALLGPAALRELFDPEAIREVESELRGCGDGAPTPDRLHAYLLVQGACAPAALAEALARSPQELTPLLQALWGEGRLIRWPGPEGQWWAAAEQAGLWAWLLGERGLAPELPPGFPTAWLTPPAEPLRELLLVFARRRGPFNAATAAAALGLPRPRVEQALRALAREGALRAGAFLPGGSEEEWCAPDVLRRIRARSRRVHQRQAAPVDAPAYARFLLDWQNVGRPRGGPEALLAALIQLAELPLPAGALEEEILPARVRGYGPSELDLLFAQGALEWRGVERLGGDDGRVLVGPRGRPPLLPLPAPEQGGSTLEQAVQRILGERGALFFPELLAATRAFPPELLQALWSLVWAGALTNDTLLPLRSLRRAADARHPRRGAQLARRLGPPGSEGRWALIRPPAPPPEAERLLLLADVLLDRYGIVSRELVQGEGLAGGFAALYPALKAMEEAGRIRRGYFVEGLGAAQFARPLALERLRAQRDRREEGPALVLSAVDPANPYGVALPWPEGQGGRPARAAGAQVILRAGRLLAYAPRQERRLLTWLGNEVGPLHELVAAALPSLLGRAGRRALLIAEIDGQPAARSPLAPLLLAQGFSDTSRGLLLRRGLAQRVF